MSETTRYGETIKPCARQGPDGKVKAGLLEPECPIRNSSGLEKMVETKRVPETAEVDVQR
jgi:hypothetical protein